MKSEDEIRLTKDNSYRKYTLTLLEASLVVSKALLANSVPPSNKGNVNKFEEIELFSKPFQSKKPELLNPRTIIEDITTPILSNSKTKESRPNSPSPSRFSRRKSSQSPEFSSKRSSRSPVSVRSRRKKNLENKARKSPSAETFVVSRVSTVLSPDRNRRIPSRCLICRYTDENREHLERLLAKNMAVCYITNLKNCIEKFKSKYCCNPERCPVLQERLYKHRLQYHPEQFRECEMVKKCDADCPNIIRNDEIQAQTKITLANLGDLMINVETKPIATNTSGFFDQRNTSMDNKVWLKNYTLEVEKTVKNWVTKIPVETQDAQDSNDEKIKHLIDKIHGLHKVIEGNDYEFEIKKLIDECLEELSIWYPGPKRDQIAFREGLRENLYERIKSMNKDHFAKHGRPSSNDSAQNSNSNNNNSNSITADSNKTTNNNTNRANNCDPECYLSEKNDNKTVSITLRNDGKADIKVDSNESPCRQHCDSKQPQHTVSNGPNVGSYYIMSDQNKGKDYEGANKLVNSDGNYASDIPIINPKLSYVINPKSYGTNTGSQNRDFNDKNTLDPRNVNNQKPYQMNEPIRNERNDRYGTELPSAPNYSSNQPRGYKDNQFNSLDGANVGVNGQNANNEPSLRYETNLNNGLYNQNRPDYDKNNTRYGENRGSRPIIQSMGLNQQDYGTNQPDVQHYNREQTYQRGYKDIQIYERRPSYDRQQDYARGHSYSPNGVDREYNQNNIPSAQYYKENNGRKPKANNEMNDRPNGQNYNPNGQDYETNMAKEQKNGPTSSRIGRKNDDTSRPNEQRYENRNGKNLVPVRHESDNYDRNRNDSKYSRDYNRGGPNTYSPNRDNRNNGTRPNKFEDKKDRSDRNTTGYSSPDKFYPNSNTNDITGTEYGPNRTTTPAKPVQKENMDSFNTNQRKYKDSDANAVKVYPNSNTNDKTGTEYGPNRTMTPAKLIKKENMDGFNTDHRKYKDSDANAEKKQNYNKQFDDDECDKSINGKSTNLSKSEPSVKCTIKSQDLCGCPDHQSKLHPKPKKTICGTKVFDIEKEVKNWLKKSSILKDDVVLSKDEVTDTLLEAISCYMHQPYVNLNKAILKNKIIEVLKKLGLCSFASGKAKSDLFKLAEELANRLIGIQSRIECTGESSWKCRLKKTIYEDLEEVVIGPNNVRRVDLKHDLAQEITECLCSTKLAGNRFIEEEIAELLIQRVDLIRRDLLESIRNELHYRLEETRELEESDIVNITDCILHNAKELITDISNVNNRTDFNRTVSVRPIISGVLAIYTSEHEIKPSTANSGTIMHQSEEHINLSPEEKVVTDKIAEEIRKWLKSAPDTFNPPYDDKKIKNVIYDLANEIVNHKKIQQLIPESNMAEDPCIKIYVYKWLIKFQMLEDLKNAELHTQKIVKKLENIKFPSSPKTSSQNKTTTKTQEQTSYDSNITANVYNEVSKSQQGSRKSSKTKLSKIRKESKVSSKTKLSKSQQGSKQISKTNKLSKSKKESKATSNSRLSKSQNEPSQDISELKKEISQGDIIKHEVTTWMNEQSSDIYEINDETSQAEHVSKIYEKIKGNLSAKKSDKSIRKDIKGWLKKITKPKEKKKIRELSENLTKRIKSLPKHEEKSKEKIPYENETKRILDTMKHHTVEYIEYDCQTDDPWTKGAYSELFKAEIKKIIPLTEEQSLVSYVSERFSAEKLNREHEIVKDITEWLKKLPIENNFVTKHRIELINDWVKEIFDVAEDSELSGTDDTIHLKDVIKKFLNKIPIIPDQKINADLMINELVATIQDRKQKVASLINTQTTGRSFPEIIDEYIQTHIQELAEDDLYLLEAWFARLFKDIMEIAKTEVVASNIDNLSVSNQKLRRTSATPQSFRIKLEYATEIADWIKNLPIVGQVDPVTISELAQKMEDHDNKMISEKELIDYIQIWITELPLSRQKELDLPFLSKQLMHRKDRVTPDAFVNGHRRLFSGERSTKALNSPVKSKISKSHLHTLAKHENTGEIIVKVIEDWCTHLPLHGAPDIKIHKAKDDLQNKLYQKIAEVNDDPRYVNNAKILISALAEVLDKELASLPDNIKVKGQIEQLKLKLLDQIQEAQTLMNKLAAGDTYRQNLLNKLDSSLPNPVQSFQNHPGFDLYKSYVVDIFILDNFDHVNEEAKAKYEENIKREIDKYSANAQKRNVMPLSKEQVFNELYGSLYRVPLPDDECLVQDVEEIKMKYEIIEWVKTLPIAAPDGDSEALKRNQKISFLAKKLHLLEKDNNFDKMFKEVTKWLHKLPLTDNTETFTVDLMEELRKNKKCRHCVKPTDVRSKDSKVILKRLDDSSKLKLDNKRENYVNHNATSNTSYAKQRGKSGDVLIQKIEDWCNNVPLPSLPKQEAQMIRDDLCKKVMMKIDELNSDPAILNEDVLYKHLLNKELDMVISTLPPNNTLTENKEALKDQLIDTVHSVKSLMLEEKSRHEYRQDLNDTLNNLIFHPETSDVDKNVLKDNKEDIIDNFIEYSVNKNDETGKQFFKNKMLESLSKYNTKVIKDVAERRAESLRKGNQLLVELSKIPPPKEQAMKEEVKEIRMKREISDFFNSLPSSSKNQEQESVLRNKRNSLTKQLRELEKEGYHENRSKMKDTINKSLKKLNLTVDDGEIDRFLDKLQNNEVIRNGLAVAKSNENIPVSDNMRYPSISDRDLLSKSLPPVEIANEQTVQSNASRLNDSSRISGVLPTRDKPLCGPILISHPNEGKPVQEESNNNPILNVISGRSEPPEFVEVIIDDSISASFSTDERFRADDIEMAEQRSMKIDELFRTPASQMSYKQSIPLKMSPYPEQGQRQGPEVFIKSYTPTVTPQISPHQMQSPKNYQYQFPDQLYSENTSERPQEIYSGNTLQQRPANCQPQQNQRYPNPSTYSENNSQSAQRALPDNGQDFSHLDPCQCPYNFVSCLCSPKQSQNERQVLASTGVSTSNRQVDQEVAFPFRDQCFCDKLPRVIGVPMFKYCDSCEEFSSYIMPVPMPWN